MQQKQVINRTFERVASNYVINKVILALEKNGMRAIFVKNRSQAREKVLELLPKNAQVMNMTSRTLEETGIAKDILESGNYHPVRSRLGTEESPQQKRMLGSAPQWAVGSVQAVTERGQVLCASATGSQLPAYAYGSEHIIWVVGGQKIVADMEHAFKRVYEYVLPLEDERARQVYGTGSGVNKMLIINKEVVPERITVIVVDEKLGF